MSNPKPVVHVVLDLSGAGRVVGVFDTEAAAEKVKAVNPAYYRRFAAPLNTINAGCVAWLQDQGQVRALKALMASDGLR